MSGSARRRPSGRRVLPPVIGSHEGLFSRHSAQRTSNRAQSDTPAVRWPTGPVTNQAANRRGTTPLYSGAPTDMATTSPVTTTVTQLPESRVRVEAEVPAAEVERRLAQAARQLARNLRVPGFRAGKAPPPVVIQRVGRAAVLDEAVRDSLGTWYAAAVDAARIVPVGEPDLDLGDLPRGAQPLHFSIEIGVRPKAELGEYKGLEVAKRDAAVSDEDVD